MLELFYNSSQGPANWFTEYLKSAQLDEHLITCENRYYRRTRVSKSSRQKGVKSIKQVKELKNNAEKVGKTLVGSRIRT